MPFRPPEQGERFKAIKYKCNFTCSCQNPTSLLCFLPPRRLSNNVKRSHRRSSGRSIPPFALRRASRFPSKRYVPSHSLVSDPNASNSRRNHLPRYLSDPTESSRFRDPPHAFPLPSLHKNNPAFLDEKGRCSRRTGRTRFLIGSYIGVEVGS